MIQILGLRDRKYGDKVKKTETFFSKGWRFHKVQDVFRPDILQQKLAEIPDNEKYNLYFTVADCFEESGRKLKEQWAIPFDVDNLALTDHAGHNHAMAIRVAQLASEALQVPYEDMPVVFTGNGVQFFIFTTLPIVDENYFDQARDAYGVLADRIQNILVSQGVQGNVDKSVWSKGRLMRLPMTENQKPNKPTRAATLLNYGGASLEFDIVKQSGIGLIQAAEVVPDSILKTFAKPDTPAVLTGCEFLKFNTLNPDKISEPQWYADISIRARLENGRELVHQASEGHPGYSHYETENKIDQALAASGPRTCKNIEQLWDGCPTCEWYNKCKTPLLIRGPNYIETAEFGFRKKRKKKDGTFEDGGVPDYQDLIKQFSLEKTFKVVEDNGLVITFDGKIWEYFSDLRLKSWMTTKVKPEPSSHEMNEFLSQLKVHHLINLDELLSNREGFMNFQNCVLNVNTWETLPHSPEFGFFDVRPYAYSATAKAPTWDKFIQDIMDQDQDMVDVLNEFAGYCVSGDRCWLQKSLLLVGEGSNGKSVFMETLGEVVGEENHSAVAIQQLEKDANRFQLVNKLFNYSEETSTRALSDSSTFKTLVSGGKILIKKLYEQPYVYANRAKIIMSANNLPYSEDKSHGLLRRLAIVHFNKQYNPGDENYDAYIKDKLLKELPGICNSLLVSYSKLKERGRLPGEVKLAEAKRQYQLESDTVYMFVNNGIEQFQDAWSKVEEVYAEYKSMAENMSFRPVTAVTFSKAFAKYTGIHSKLKSVNGSKIRVFEGVKLNKGF